LIINMSPLLEFQSDPTCSQYCQGQVTHQPDNTAVFVDFTGSVSVKFSLRLSLEATAGTFLYVNVSIVGGVRAVSMASATIAVVAPTPITSGWPEDNRDFWVWSTPNRGVIEPGGTLPLRIGGSLWGMWGEPSPDVTYTLSFPSVVDTTFTPTCGSGESIMSASECKQVAGSQQGDHFQLTIIPGNGEGGYTQAIYLPLTLDPDAPFGQAFEIQVTGTVQDDTYAGEPSSISMQFTIGDGESRSLPEAPTQATFLYEATAGFKTTEAGCSMSASLSIWRLGFQDFVADAYIDEGRILPREVDGNILQVCQIPVSFTAVNGVDFYIVADTPGIDTPCRSCVAGVISIGNNAQSIVGRYYAP